MGSSSDGGETENYVAHLYMETREGFKHLSEEEDIGYVMYYAEKNRRKPSLLRRGGEKIGCIARIYYPFIIKKFRDNYGLIFDPLQENPMRLSYILIDRNETDRFLEELANLREKTFLDKIVEFEKFIKDACSGSHSSTKREYDLKNVVDNPEVIKELKIMLNKITEYEFPGVKITGEEIPLEEYISTVNKVIDEVSETIGYVTSVLTRLSKILDDWKMDIAASYGEKIRDLELRYEELKREVNAKINEINTKKEEEISSIRNRYRDLLRDIENRINQLGQEIKKLKVEKDHAREYGEEDKEIKKKISSLEKELKNLEKKREEIKARMDEEIKAINNRYNELVENERQRLRSLLNEKKRLDEELESLTRQGETRVNKIRENLLKYIEEIKNVEKKIMDLAVPVPAGGEGLYWIPIYIVIYMRKEEYERIEVVTPTYISMPGKLVRHANPYVFEYFDEYVHDKVESIARDLSYREWFEERNLLRRVPIERIEIGLSMLAEKNVFSHKDVEKIVDSLKKQVS